VTGLLRGFWSISTTAIAEAARGGCVVVDPSTGFVANGSSLFTHTDRDVDYWGSSLDRRRQPITNRSNRASRSKLAQRHRLDRVIPAFAQN
jgi:hypothetical protein